MGEQTGWAASRKKVPNVPSRCHIGSVQQVQRLLKKETHGKEGGGLRPLAYFLTCFGRR